MIQEADQHLARFRGIKVIDGFKGEKQSGTRIVGLEGLYITFIGVINEDRRWGKGMAEPIQCRAFFQVCNVIDVPVARITIVIGQVGEGQHSGMGTYASKPFGFALQPVSLEGPVFFSRGIFPHIVVEDLGCELGRLSVAPEPDPAVFIYQLGST